MCVFIDSPLAHPSNKSPPTRRQFSPPSAVWLRWWVLCSMADSSRRLAVSQPTWRHQGVATGTRRQDPSSENAFSVPPFDLKGPNASQAASGAEWKDIPTQGTKGNMNAYVCIYAYKWRLFTRKTDNQTSVIFKRDNLPMRGSAHISTSALIQLASWVSGEEMASLIGQKQKSFTTSARKGAFSLFMG